MATGSKNGFWKGGRTVSSNGYVLLRVGTLHHLADVRGYAYEHRVVAEQIIGRQLLPGEQVHHIDGNRQNNSTENLQVVSSIADHRRVEGKRNPRLRIKGQPNPETTCSCGCGLRFSLFDNFGRPRKFATGHNMMRRRRNGNAT